MPALAGALAGLVVALTGNRVVRVVAVLAAGAVAVVVLAPTVSLFFPALGLSSGAAPAFVAAMLAVALLPAFELLFPDPYDEGPTAGTRVGAAVVPLVALFTAAACAVGGFLVDTFDEAHPVPSELVYVLDTDAGTAWWATTEANPGPYTAGYVGEGDQLNGSYPYLDHDDVRTGAADVAELPAPEVTVVSDARRGGAAGDHRPGDPAPSRRAAVDRRAHGRRGHRGACAGRRPGCARRGAGESRLRVTFHAPPDDGLQATFSVSGDGEAALRVIDGSDGLDDLPGFEPRPEGVDAAGSHSSDLVLVASTTDLG